MNHSVEFSNKLIAEHFTRVVHKGAGVLYKPKTVLAHTLWKHTGICSNCGRRAISCGRCTSCGVTCVDMLAVGEMCKATVSFSGNAQFTESGVLERTHKGFVLRTKDGSRVFPLAGWSHEVWLTDETPYLQQDSPTFVVADPTNYSEAPR